MNRRGFFSKLFSGKPEEIFFGVQFVVLENAIDGLRDRLHELINNNPVKENANQKAQFYKKITGILESVIDFNEYGFWDYITKNEDAQAEFENWVSQINASFSTENEQLVDDALHVDRISSSKDYICVTLLFLLETSENISNFIDLIENISEDDYYSKSTFTKLLYAINLIDFEYSFADAAFLIPGNKQDGLSWEDIHGEGWEYLKPIL